MLHRSSKIFLKRCPPSTQPVYMQLFTRSIIRVVYCDNSVVVVACASNPRRRVMGAGCRRGPRVRSFVCASVSAPQSCRSPLLVVCCFTWGARPPNPQCSVAEYLPRSAFRSASCLARLPSSPPCCGRASGVGLRAAACLVRLGSACALGAPLAVPRPKRAGVAP